MQTLFDIPTGKVLLNGEEAGMPPPVAGKTAIVDGYYIYPLYFLAGGEPTERPVSPVTRTDLTLHDVPEGSTLFINGESYPAEGEVELEFPLPGTFALRVECFPFLDWADEVTV